MGNLWQPNELEEFGLSELPENMRDELLEKLEDITQLRLTDKLSEVLDDTELKAFTALQTTAEQDDWVMKNADRIRNIVTDIKEQIKDELANKQKLVLTAYNQKYRTSDK